MEAIDHFDRSEVVETDEQAARAIGKTAEPGAGDEAVELSVAVLENAGDRGLSTVVGREVGDQALAGVGLVDVYANRAMAFALELGGGGPTDAGCGACDRNRLHYELLLQSVPANAGLE